MSADERRGFYVEEIQKLMAQMGAAKDTATVQAIFQQIQGDISSLWGLEGGKDQGTALQEYLNSLLEQAKAISDAFVGNEAYNAVKDNEALAAAIEAERLSFSKLDEALTPAVNKVGNLTTSSDDAAKSLNSLQTATDTAAEGARGLRADFDELRTSIRGFIGAVTSIGADAGDRAGKDAVGGAIASNNRALMNYLKANPAALTAAGA
jgi:chromosome segregation ATPase